MNLVSVRHQLLAILVALTVFVLQWFARDYAEPSVGLFFFPAVILAALFVGRECGIATSLYSAILTQHAFVPPRFPFLESDPVHVLTAAYAAAMGVFISVVIDRIRCQSLRLTSPDKRIYYRRAIEEAPFPIMIHADDGEVLSINRAWTEITGYALSDIPTLDRWTERAHGELKDSARTVIALLYDRTCRKNEVEKDASEKALFIRCRDGSHRFWEFSSVGLGRLSDGRRIAISMATDVSQRKQVEATLNETRAILQAAMDQSPIGISVANAPDGSLRYVNPAGLLIRGDDPQRRISGIGLAEYLADKVQSHLDGTPLAAHEFPLLHTVSSGEAMSKEFILRRPDGSERFVFANASPIRNQDNEVVAAISIFIDMTDRKHAENEAERNDRYQRALLDNFPFLVWLKDTQSNFLAVNLTVSIKTMYCESFFD